MSIATKQIYTKDKTMKITFRCDGALSDWIARKAAQVGLTPSALVRQICYQNLYGEVTLQEALSSKTSAETAVDNANG